jgi:hypothetical protein
MEEADGGGSDAARASGDEGDFAVERERNGRRGHELTLIDGTYARNPRSAC